MDNYMKYKLEAIRYKLEISCWGSKSLTTISASY